MKAAVYYGRQDVRVEDVEETPVGPSDVRIDVAACGICGTDIHEFNGGPIFIPEEPHPRTGKTHPLTMGHEFSGVINEVGKDVSRIAVGDRVTVHPNIPCHDCTYCDEGEYNRCKNAAAIGLQTGTGGFAESAVVPSQQVHRLPDAVSLEEGALVEPFAVGMHAVRRSGVKPGDTVAVFGCGPIGLTAIHAANRAGAKRIIASEPQDFRREVAAEMGADDVVNPIETDAVKYVTSRTDDGVEHAFEFAGLDAAFNAAVNSTRRGGIVTVGSISEEETTTNLNDVVTTERQVVGTNCYGFPPRSFHTEFDAVIQGFAEGEIEADPYVTARIDLDDIVESGFEAILDGDEPHVKVLAEP